MLNDILVRLAKDLELPLVATNDVHYAEREDAEAHLEEAQKKKPDSLRSSVALASGSAASSASISFCMARPA